MLKICLLSRFVRPLFIVSLTAMLCFLSCNGNGGSHDGGGAVYTPGEGGGNSGTADATGGDSRNQFTAGELLKYSNTGEIDRVVELFSTNQAMAETQTIVLHANDIGLPAGGTATLTISGGVSFSGTVRAAADGSVTFVIPATPSGITITVALSVANASGTVLYSGSSQETLSDDWLDINLPLYRLFWTLPASISLTASPDGFAYDSTKLSETTTLSISGLEDAPAGTALSYAWELDSSPLSDSGPSITRSWNELIGPAAPTVEQTRTFTVTVSYTDIAGEAKTASASTDVIIGPPVTIPAFTVQIIANSKNGENSSGTDYAFYSTYGGSFTFKVVEAESFFPAGTSFSWSISRTGGSTYTAEGMNVTKTLEALGLTTAGVTADWTVTCTASNARAAAPVTGGGDSSMSGRALVLPSITLIQTSSITGCAPADNTSFSGDTYAFANASSGSFTLTAVTSGTAVTGMKYSWSITGSSFSYDSTTGNTCTVSLSDLTGFAGHKNSAGSWTVTCELTYTGLSSVSQTTTLSAFLLVIPEFTVSVSAGSGLNEASGSTATSRVFLVGTTDLSKSLTFTVNRNDGEPDFPSGTEFLWSATAGTSATENVGISTFATAVPPSQTSCNVTCQPRCAGISGDMEWVDFDLKPRIRLDAPTGLTLNTPYVNGGGGSVSATTPGIFNFEGVDVNDVRVPFTWTAPSVPADKKFKFSIYVDDSPFPTVTGNFGTAPGASCSCTLGGADETGGWGTHTITVVTAIDPNDPEYESSVPAGPITITINGGP